MYWLRPCVAEYLSKQRQHPLKSIPSGVPLFHGQLPSLQKESQAVRYRETERGKSTWKFVFSCFYCTGCGRPVEQLRAVLVGSLSGFCLGHEIVAKNVNQSNAAS